MNSIVFQQILLSSVFIIDENEYLKQFIDVPVSDGAIWLLMRFLKDQFDFKYLLNLYCWLGKTNTFDLLS